MTLQYTNYLKGIAIIFVVLAHLGPWMLGIGAFSALGPIAVSIFTILSGYGLVISYQQNPNQNFFKKRFLRLLPYYYVGVLIYITLSILVGKEIDNIYEVIFLFDLNWFIQWIVVFYVIFYVYLKYNIEYILFFASFLIWAFYPNSLWVEVAFSIYGGAFLALNFERLESFLDMKKVLISLSMSVLLLVISFNFNEVYLHKIRAVAYAIIAINMIIVLIRFNVVKILSRMGEKSYQIYLIHIVLLNFLYLVDNKFIMLVIQILGIFGIYYCVDFIAKFFNKHKRKLFVWL